MAPGAVRPLDLLYVVGAFPAISETFVVNEICGLAERGHRITVASLKRGDGPLPAHTRVRYLEIPFAPLMWQLPLAGRGAGREPGETLPRTMYATAAARWVGKRVTRPDVVHAHFINRPTLVARRIAARLGAPATFMTHASDYRVGTDPVAVQERLRSAAAALVISEAARRQLAQMIADPSVAFGSNVHVVRACMGSLTFPPAAPRGTAGLDIVTVARLVPKKGIDIALRAFAALAATRADVRYRIAGDGPERAALTALAGTLGIADRVEFLGAVASHEARALIASADIALLPCRVDAKGDVDGIPVFLMEAGAAGVAVVSTSVSGIPELVESGCSGLLTVPDDVQATAEALFRLGDDPIWRKALGSNLRARVAAEFSQDTQLDRLEQIWSGLVNGRPALNGPAASRA